MFLKGRYRLVLMLVLAIGAFLAAPRAAQAQDADWVQGAVVSAKTVDNQLLVTLNVDKAPVVVDFTETQVYATIDGKQVLLTQAQTLKALHPGATVVFKPKKPKGGGSHVVIAIIAVLIG